MITFRRLPNGVWGLSATTAAELVQGSTVSVRKKNGTFRSVKVGPLAFSYGGIVTAEIAPEDESAPLQDPVTPDEIIPTPATPPPLPQRLARVLYGTFAAPQAPATTPPLATSPITQAPAPEPQALAPAGSIRARLAAQLAAKGQGRRAS